MSDQALELIQHCYQTKDPYLDLGNCGLTDEAFAIGSPIDAALCKCTHIRTLILSAFWSDLYESDSNGSRHSRNSGLSNKLSTHPPAIEKFSGLSKLVCAGDRDNEWAIKDMIFVKKLTDLVFLNLSFNQIEELKGLDALKNLKTFYIHNNRINELKGLSALTNLESFHINNNKISELKGLDGLTKLKSFHIYKNRINELKGLDALTSLKALYIRSNQISELKGMSALKKLDLLSLNDNQITKITGLETLKNLKSLYICDNQICELEGLNTLENLTTLDISHNHISELKGLYRLSNLRKLDISNNKIVKLKGLFNISRIKILDIGYNQIDELMGLDSLIQLKTLTISHNQITELKGLDKLIVLESLDVNHNKIGELKELEALTKIQSLKYVDLDHNKVLNEIPSEVVKVGWRAIKDWLISNQQDELEEINEIKLLLLGNTTVGKSTLLEYFRTGIVPKKMDSTFGIQYRLLSNLITGININCWDFGGQEYFHATHQLFFSPGALHLALWNKKEIIEKNTNEEAFFELSYWFRCITWLLANFKETGPSNNAARTQVVVCENKIVDEYGNFAPSPIDQKIYSRQFPDLNIDYKHINLIPKVEELLDALKLTLSLKAKGLCNKHSKKTKRCLDKIRNSAKPFMLIKDFEDKDPEEVKTAMEVLRNMGIVIYFPNLMPEKVFTKPQLLLDLLYKKILSSELKESKEPFSISKEEIEKAITDNNELKLSLEEVLALLLHFDLIFKIPAEEGMYFIPQYMPESVAFDSFTNSLYELNTIRIESDHYLMNLAMLKIYSRYGGFVKKDKKNGYLFWKDSIVIEKGDQALMIRFSRKDQRIELFQNSKKDSFDLLHELVDFVINIPIKPGKSRVIGMWQRDEFTFHKHDVNWLSTFFDVYVGDGTDYFIYWNELVRKSKIGMDKVDFYKSGKQVNEYDEGKAVLIAGLKQFLPRELLDKTKKTKSAMEKKSKTGDTFIFNAGVENSQIGGHQNVQINKTELKDNKEFEELKSLILELQEFEDVDLEWKKSLTVLFEEMHRMELAGDKVGQSASQTKFEYAFKKLKNLKDWVGIALLPGEITSKGEKMIELWDSVKKMLGH